VRQTAHAYIAGMKNHNQNGFTLYELLVTLLIVGIVLSFGLPNLRALTQNSRVTTTANDLHSSIVLARSESARAKTNVTICGSRFPILAPDCDGIFDDGWIVFVDTDGDIALDAGENVLRAYSAIDANLDIVTNGGATYFGFASTGLGRGDVAGAGPALQSARICDERGNVVVVGDSSSAARVLIVTPIGRATVLRDVDQITFQGGCP